MNKRLMKIRKNLFFVMIIALLLPACGGQETPQELPTPQSIVTTVPSVDSYAQNFLDAWHNGDYTGMYDQLSASAKQTISQEDFTAYYGNMVSSATMQTVDTELLSTSLSPDSATAKYKATFNTALFGSFEREMTMTFALENGSWKVNWDSGLIMPELSGGNHLSLEVLTNQRGAIYDKNGDPIANETKAWSLAIIPNQIEDGKEGTLLSVLSELTGRTTESIQASYDDLRLTDWYVAVGEASDAEVQAKCEVPALLVVVLV